MKIKKSIQPEFILKVSLISLFVSALFIMMNFMFLFVVEDEFLDRNLRQEKAKVEAYYQNTGKLPQSDSAKMKIYQTIEDLPDGIGAILIEEPARREFSGKGGRHYHVAQLSAGAYLVSEVSSQLIIRPMRKGLVMVYGLLALIAVGVSCFVAYRMARKTIQPLTQLALSISTLKPDQLPQGFASDYPDNEIGVLALQLEGSMHRIYEFIEREQQFSRDVSHDLRTPLAASSGALEILQTQDVSESHSAQLLERIKVANTHMSLTISALLSMAREKKEQEPKGQPILSVTEKIILQFSDLLNGKDIELDVNIPLETRFQAADGVLEILLSNIIGNAFQYTTEGMITISYVDGKLSISDTAGGIPADLKKTLFDKNTRSEHSSGYGLGLSIVKRLCEYHDIEISIDHFKGGTSIILS